MFSDAGHDGVLFFDCLAAFAASTRSLSSRNMRIVSEVTTVASVNFRRSEVFPFFSFPTSTRYCLWASSSSILSAIVC